jgi:hypothetical protein
MTSHNHRMYHPTYDHSPHDTYHNKDCLDIWMYPLLSDLLLLMKLCPIHVHTVTDYPTTQLPAQNVSMLSTPSSIHESARQSIDHIPTQLILVIVAPMTHPHISSEPATEISYRLYHTPGMSRRLSEYDSYCTVFVSRHLSRTSWEFLYVASWRMAGCTLTQLGSPITRWASNVTTATTNTHYIYQYFTSLHDTPDIEKCRQP